MERCKLWVADTGAEPKGKGVPGPSHPKARFVPKGTGLKTMGDGSRMGRRDRRGRRGSRVHSKACQGGRKDHRDSMGSGQEATQLVPTSRVGQPPPR